MRNKTLRVVDLYSGCGGLSLGFQNAGFDVVAAFDNWQAALKIHENNKHLFNHPIFKLDLSKVPEDLSIFSQYKPDMIIGGPPCQDFSSAGKRDESLGRADLTVVFAKIVSALKTKWFVMENVDRAIKSNAYAKAIQVVRKAGFGLTLVVLDASYYNVPQKRLRSFLIGELNGEDDALSPFIERRRSNKPMTVRDFLGNSLGIKHYYRHPRSYMRRAIFSIDEPSPTIRGVNRPVPQGYRGHPGDTVKVTPSLRPLTTKERSLIQTFPFDFDLSSNTKTDVEQMIGNAVPVNLAKEVARSILDYVKLDKPFEPKREYQLSMYYK